MSDTELIIKIIVVIYTIIGIFVAAKTPEPRHATELEALFKLFFAAYFWPLQLCVNRINSKRNK